MIKRMRATVYSLRSCVAPTPAFAVARARDITTPPRTPQQWTGRRSLSAGYKQKRLPPTPAMSRVLPLGGAVMVVRTCVSRSARDADVSRAARVTGCDATQTMRIRPHVPFFRGPHWQRDLLVRNPLPGPLDRAIPLTGPRRRRGRDSRASDERHEVENVHASMRLALARAAHGRGFAVADGAYRGLRPAGVCDSRAWPEGQDRRSDLYE